MNHDNANPSASDARVSDLLAPWTYQSEEFLALERARLFKRQWLLAGHVSDLPAPRDYLTFDAVGERALVLRDGDGVLRAFHNVCRHRGAKLLDRDRGRCPKLLTCPFHGWSYRLDGALAKVPAAETFDRLDFAEHGLAPLAMEIWMGFIFIRFVGDGESLAQRMKPVERLLAPYQLERMQPLAGTRVGQTRGYNWKTIHDIDNEGYHVPVGHPALQQLYGDDYRDDSIDGVSVSFGYLNQRAGALWSVRHYHRILPDFAHLPTEQRRLWLYVGIFPSMVLALYPDSMEFYMSLPLAVESTRYLGGAYALPDSNRAARAARYLGRRINREADREDEAFMRQLYQGMKSSAFPTPHLSSIEHGVRDFHRKIQRALPVAHLADAPPPGCVAQVNARMNATAANES
ncbi:MAG: aromatic ring-hydroxylating oxygenase subunit alpha [bacterium]